MKNRLGRWVVKESPDKALARILIPKTDIRGPLFERDFTWLMDRRYKIDTSGIICRRLRKGLRTGTGESGPFLIDEDAVGLPCRAGRTASLVFHEKTVLVRIMGRHAKDGFRGRLTDFRFNHSRLPGRRNADGSMNWYELEKYVVVQKGDLLCTVVEPVQGTSGLSVFNEPLPPRPAPPLDLELGGGIERRPVTAGNNGRTAKQLSAKVDGVLVFEHSRKGRLRAIDVVREIKVRSLCFQTGNMGEPSLRIPVPVSLEELRPNFKLYSTALVRCGEVYGGFVSTEDSAELGIVNSGSRIWAGKEIRAGFVQNSTLEAHEVSVSRTLVDATIRADRFSALGDRLFPVTNTEVDALAVQMNQVLIQGGENLIDLGRSRVLTHDAAKASAGRQSERISLLEEKRGRLLDSIRSDLIGIIKKTARDKRGRLMEFARKMNAYPESEVLARLDRFKGYDNMNRVEAMKRKLGRLSEVKSLLSKTVRQRETAHVRQGAAMDDIRRIEYRISGFVAPGGVLTIRYRDWETVYAADKGTHLSLGLAGRMGGDGRILVIEDNFRPVQNPLSYPQVQAKDASAVV